MRFTHENQVYEILFSRDHRMVEIIDRTNNTKSDEWSKFPATSVFILKVDEKKQAQFWEVIASTEVACHRNDKFDLEEGRVWALKKLSGVKDREGNVIYPRLLETDMISLMWEAYNNRPKLGNLKEQNHNLRQEVAKLKTENIQLTKQLEAASAQAEDLDNHYMSQLQKGA